MQVARNYPSCLEADLEVIAVGPDSRAAFRRFFTVHRIAFPGIPDPEGNLADTYGQQRVWWKGGRLPCQFLIERGRGVVRFAEYSRTMGRITPIGDVLVMARHL